VVLPAPGSPMIKIFLRILIHSRISVYLEPAGRIVRRRLRSGNTPAARVHSANIAGTRQQADRARADGAMA
jgi:hypothetical protein